MNFLSSDFHFYHSNLVRGTTQWEDKQKARPFNTPEEMNDTLLRNINDLISENDILYYLGDFAVGVPQKLQVVADIRNKIKCKTIHFIVGNHDPGFDDKPKKKEEKRRELEKIFTSVHDIWHTKIEGVHVTLCHFALKTWFKQGKGAVHAYGHSHGNLADDINALSCDVGVDAWNYKPVSFIEFMNKMSTKVYKQIDHH